MHSQNPAPFFDNIKKYDTIYQKQVAILNLQRSTKKSFCLMALNPGNIKLERGAAMDITVSKELESIK